jgi:hypothetical protein
MAHETKKSAGDRSNIKVGVVGAPVGREIRLTARHLIANDTQAADRSSDADSGQRGGRHWVLPHFRGTRRVASRFLYPVMGADDNPGPVAGPAEIGIVRDAAQFVW